MTIIKKDSYYVVINSFNETVLNTKNVPELVVFLRSKGITAEEITRMFEQVSMFNNAIMEFGINNTLTYCKQIGYNN